MQLNEGCNLSISKRERLEVNPLARIPRENYSEHKKEIIKILLERMSGQKYIQKTYHAYQATWNCIDNSSFRSIKYLHFQNVFHPFWQETVNHEIVLLRQEIIILLCLITIFVLLVIKGVLFIVSKFHKKLYCHARNERSRGVERKIGPKLLYFLHHVAGTNHMPKPFPNSK